MNMRKEHSSPESVYNVSGSVTKSSGDVRSPLSRAFGRQFVFNTQFQTRQFATHAPAEDLAELRVTWTAWTAIQNTSLSPDTRLPSQAFCTTLVGNSSVHSDSNTLMSRGRWGNVSASILALPGSNLMLNRKSDSSPTHRWPILFSFAVLITYVSGLLSVYTVKFGA